MASGQTSANSFALLDYSSAPPKKARKRLGKPVSLHDFHFPNLPENQNNIDSNYAHPKYITATALDDKKPLKNYNQLLIRKGVDAISTKFSSANYLRDGSLLLLVENTRIAERLNSVKELANIPVKINYHGSLNTVKGTAYSPEFRTLTQEELLEAFRSQGATEVAQITRPGEGGARVPTGLVILTFNAYIQPKDIEGAWSKILIRELYPTPMRCRNCQKLGHTAKHCHAPAETCGTCGLPGPHGPGSCGRKYCVYCDSE